MQISFKIHDPHRLFERSFYDDVGVEDDYTVILIRRAARDAVRIWKAFNVYWFAVFNKGELPK